MITRFLIEHTKAIPCPVYATDKGFYTCNPWKALFFETRDVAQVYMKKNNFEFPWMAMEHTFYMELLNDND
jgi:hypothetical protein